MLQMPLLCVIMTSNTYIRTWYLHNNKEVMSREEVGAGKASSL